MKSNKKLSYGFSMIELLVSLLIMAIILATTVALYVGIFDNVKNSADKEVAREIKKQIIFYMSASNDINLSCIRHESSITGNDVVDALTTGVSITSATVGKEQGDKDGTYGGYFEGTSPRPKESKKGGWDIIIDSSTMNVSVVSSNSNGGNGSLTVT